MSKKHGKNKSRREKRLEATTKDQDTDEVFDEEDLDEKDLPVAGTFIDPYLYNDALDDDPAGLFTSQHSDKPQHQPPKSGVTLNKGEKRTEPLGDEYLGEVKDEGSIIPDVIAALPPDLQTDLMMYDNPEDIMKPGQQTYNLSIVNTRPDLAPANYIPELPQNLLPVVQAQIERQPLIDMMMARLMRLIYADSQAKGENLGYSDLLTEALDKDNQDSTLALLNQMVVFFTRIYPHLMVKVFNMTLAVSTTAMFRPFIEDADEREKATDAFLEPSLKEIKSFLKARLNVRQRGRPQRLTEGLAGNVWKIALDLMGDKRGLGSAPALKTVADRLDLTTNCLSKRLKALGRGWKEVIKPELESLPPSVLPFGYKK